MNLQSQITEVRARISEPYADDPEDQQVTDDQIVEWIRQAELRLYYDLSEEALGATAQNSVVETALTTGGTGYVTLPTSPLMLRPVSVSVLYDTGGTYRECKRVRYEDYLRASSDPNWRTNKSNPIAAFQNGNIYTSPWKSGQSVKLLHVIQPQPRYRHFRGSVTSKTTNLIWADTKAVAAGYPDDFFLTVGYLSCDLKYVSGEPDGRTVDVTDYTGSTGTFTTAVTSWPISQDTVFPPDVNIGDKYEVGQVSQLPEAFDLPVFAYVEYMCFRKDREELAEASLKNYEAEVQRINSAFGYSMQGGRS